MKKIKKTEKILVQRIDEYNITNILKDKSLVQYFEEIYNEDGRKELAEKQISKLFKVVDYEPHFELDIEYGDSWSSGSVDIVVYVVYNLEETDEAFEKRKKSSEVNRQKAKERKKQKEQEQKEAEIAEYKRLKELYGDL